jgi:hypothetical protein
MNHSRPSLPHPPDQPTPPAPLPNRAAASHAPLAKAGDLAVFLRRTVPRKDEHGNPLYEVSVYNVAVGPRAGRSYVEVFGNVAGTNLEPEMVLELMKGEAIELEFPARDGTAYVASLVNGGVHPRTYKNSVTQELRVVKVGHINRRLDGMVIGYRVPDGRGGEVEFYKPHFLKAKGQPDGPTLEMDAAHCYRLVQGGPGTEVELERGTVRFEGVGERVFNGKTYFKAELKLRYHAQAQSAPDAGEALEGEEAERGQAQGFAP